MSPNVLAPENHEMFEKKDNIFHILKNIINFFKYWFFVSCSAIDS